MSDSSASLFLTKTGVVTVLVRCLKQRPDQDIVRVALMALFDAVNNNDVVCFAVLLFFFGCETEKKKEEEE